MSRFPFRRRPRIVIGLAACLLGVALATAAAPPAGTEAPAPKRITGGALSLGAWSVHAGGANVSGGGYSGTVSIGQVERPLATVSAAGPYELTTGWLARAVQRPDALFDDGFEP